MKDLRWIGAQRRQWFNPDPDVARAPSPAVDGLRTRAGAPALHWAAPPLLVMICLALVSASVGWSYGRQANPLPVARLVVITGGDTLWSIGATYAGRHDVRDWMMRTAEIQGWRESLPTLRPGQSLTIEDWRAR